MASQCQHPVWTVSLHPHINTEQDPGQPQVLFFKSSVWLGRDSNPTYQHLWRAHVARCSSWRFLQFSSLIPFGFSNRVKKLESNSQNLSCSQRSDFFIFWLFFLDLKFLFWTPFCRTRNICSPPGGSGWDDCNSVESYLKETDQWTMISPLIVGRFQSCAFVAEGKIFVVGGWVFQSGEKRDSSLLTLRSCCWPWLLWFHSSFLCIFFVIFAATMRNQSKSECFWGYFASIIVAFR